MVEGEKEGQPDRVPGGQGPALASLRSRFLDVWCPGAPYVRLESNKPRAGGLDAWSRAPAAPPLLYLRATWAESYSPREGSQGQAHSWIEARPSGLAVLSWHQQNGSSRPISVPTWSLGLEQRRALGWVGSG